MRNEKVSIDTDAPNFILFFLLALRLVSGLPMCVCVCLFFCIVCRKLSVIQWQFTAGSSHAPFLLPQLETPSCESCKSQVPCFTSVHRSVPGSFCIALFRFAVFRSVQFRWFIYLVFLSSSIIKLRLCAVRCFFIARQSEEQVRMRTCFKEPSMTMTTWTHFATQTVTLTVPSVQANGLSASYTEEQREGLREGG